MMKWLKRIRGVLGTALTWAAAWSGLGTILWGVPYLVGGSPFGVVAGLFTFAVTFGVMGFIGGAAFSTVLGIAEGRRSFDEMSLPRFAAWGAVGGGLMSVLMFAAGSGVNLGSAGMIGAIALMGAGSAAGSLALARRAEDRELLEAGEEALGLTEAASPLEGYLGYRYVWFKR